MLSGVIFFVFKDIKTAIFVLMILLSTESLCQQHHKNESTHIMFYNVENLFDTEDDPLTIDEEFTPDGARHWNNYRLKEKLTNIAKVIVAVGQWQAPGIIGLCEVENYGLLEKLVNHPILAKYKYRIIHKESPDHRGIDVALLYREEIFKPLWYKHFPVVYPHRTSSSTREILYVCGQLFYEDTVHFFVNHWPSRYSGYLESEHKRIAAAKTVKKSIDSLQAEKKSPLIFLMGDFNDYPNNKSLQVTLGAHLKTTDISANELYNLAAIYLDKTNLGTHKHGAHWGTLDQIIVSGSFFNHPHLSISDLQNIFFDDFLLSNDEKYLGKKPNRTFIGFSYNGGFSDHMPVYVIISTK